MASELVDRLRYEANLIRAERNGCKELTPRSQTIDEGADRIEELEAALKPFAEAGASYSHFQENVDIAWQDFSIGQLRAASKALKP